eukprot:3413009-Pleurochrysis_carterae.AAC.2
MAAEIEELKEENQWLRNEITELKGIPEPGIQDVFPRRRLHPRRQLGHRRGHHYRAPLAQPGAGPFSDLRSLLSYQAADPPPQGAARGR